jgi:nucleotide-binding universal stress UspA family protein
MSIQTVTTILEGDDNTVAQLNAAIGVARALDAHLHVLALATTLDLTIGAPSMMMAEVPVGLDLQDSIARAEALGDAATARLTHEDIRWHVEPLAMTGTGGQDALLRHLRYSDLLVQQRPEDPRNDTHMNRLAHSILFDAGAPLLLLPQGYVPVGPPERVMICWDESQPALRAVRRAMPILSRASFADVVMVDPPQDAPNRSDPGGAFGQFLARHGIKCELSVVNRSDGDIATALADRARLHGYDMMVMGAFGHSRLREALFGGTTRSILGQGDVPVFMAH